MCFANCILGVLSFWANIHLSVTAYHVCSFMTRCREKQREGESREVEASHDHIEEGGKGGETRGQGARERQKQGGGTSSPFYSGPDIHGYCQVTVGVESRQNTNIPPFWFS